MISSIQIALLFSQAFIDQFLEGGGRIGREIANQVDRNKAEGQISQQIDKVVPSAKNCYDINIEIFNNLPKKCNDYSTYMIHKKQ